MNLILFLTNINASLLSEFTGQVVSQYPSELAATQIWFVHSARYSVHASTDLNHCHIQRLTAQSVHQAVTATKPFTNCNITLYPENMWQHSFLKFH